MANSLVLSLSALLALVPACILSYRRQAARPDPVFWAVLAAAVAGPAAYALVQLGESWKTGLSTTLWVSIAASAAIFTLLAAVTREAWRLMALLLPYLLLMGGFATIWSHVPARGGLAGAPDAWLSLHVGLAVATYGLCTIAAVAGAAVVLQERAIKRKRPTGLTHRLPSVSDAQRLQVRLLGASAAVLGLGILTGMARQLTVTGRLLEFDHKTLLSILAFAVIALLLVLHRVSGLRGARAARLILLAYLLLTLAYPGVKFVTDVLIG
ncbi:MAG: cytochrome c biogenesis protein CcsA [Kiloniellaceae bacterium]